jgi:hypothetical protein
MGLCLEPGLHEARAPSLIFFAALSIVPGIAFDRDPSLTNNDCRLGWLQPGGPRPGDAGCTRTWSLLPAVCAGRNL